MADTTVRTRAPLQVLTLPVERVVPETPDTVSLVMAEAPAPLQYKAGQFCTVDVRQFSALRPFVAFLEQQKGRMEPARSYSVASAPHEGRLVLTVKEEPFEPPCAWPPLLSPYLVHAVKPGDVLTVTGFQGPYVLPEDVEARTDHVVHVVAGSGSVPNFAILKDALHRGRKLRHTFVYSNRTWADACFRKALHDLALRHPGKLRVVHALTREPEGFAYSEHVRAGRIGEALLRELVPDLGTALFYVCGPAISSWERRRALETGTQATPRFLEAVLGHLHSLGVSDKHIKREAFG
ncbi:MAG: oxidoreductase [Deltaproteobacteria bacterium]|nr:oxidoreductase [Deltaproteobacteria bacterium]